MGTNTESTSSNKFTPLTIADMMPTLLPLLSPESPDSSYLSVEDDENSFLETKKKVSPLKEHNENIDSKQNMEVDGLPKTNFHIENNEDFKENFISNNITYPNKDSLAHSCAKEILKRPCPSSEVKKRSLLLPYNKISSTTEQEIVNKHHSRNMYENQTPEVLKNMPGCSQKTKIPTPKIKSGIRMFTPGSGRKNQKRTPLKLTTNQNKESMRCLFPESKHKGEMAAQSVPHQQELVHPTPETPLNRKPMSSSYVATPSYPQGRMGTNTKVSLRTINIKGKNYMYLRKLGTGGSSEVHKVLELSTLSEYAVKVVDLAKDSDLAQGYCNEVRLLKELQGSDRVIRLFDYDYDKVKQTLRLVLEVGEDLSVLLRSWGPDLLCENVICYWRQMLMAVDHIHERGVIHADLKPANFLLVSGKLKLIDFGIASAVASDATSVVRPHATGTYSYISPEALLGGAGGYGAPSAQGEAPIKISLRSDVWSLGCILYRMVYGRTPFEHIPNLAKLAVIIDPNHRIDYPPVKIADLPVILIAALKWCLTYNSKLRPTVRQLLALPYVQASVPHPAQLGAPLPAPLVAHLKPMLRPDEYHLLTSFNAS